MHFTISSKRPRSTFNTLYKNCLSYITSSSGAILLSMLFQMTVWINFLLLHYKGLPRWLSGREPTCQAGDTGLILGSGRSSREGNGNPLQYSCLGNSLDRGAWRATGHGVTESDTTACPNHHGVCYGLCIHASLCCFMHFHFHLIF